MLDLITLWHDLLCLMLTKTCIIHDPEEIMGFFGDVLVNQKRKEVILGFRGLVLFIYCLCET